MRRHTLPAAFPVLILALVSATSALAQARTNANTVPTALVSERASYRVVFDHNTGTFSATHPGGSSLVPVNADPVVVPIPPDRSVEVVIRNANTLLYDYKVTSAPIGEKRVRACREIGRHFAAAVFLIGTRGAVADRDPYPSFGELWRRAEQMRTGPPELERLAGVRGAVSAQQVLMDAQREYGEFSTLVSNVEMLASTLGDSLAMVAEFAESTPIETLLDRVERSITRLDPALTNPVELPRVVLREYTDVQQTLEVLRGAAGNGDGAADFEREAQSMTAGAAEKLQRVRSAAHRLQGHLDTLHRARAGATQVFLLPPAETIRQIRIELSETPRFSRGADSIPRVLTGQVDVYTQPHVSMICQLSIGFAWMRAPADYGVSGSTNQLVDRSADGPLRSSVGLLFHLAPEFFPNLGPVAGVGLGLGTGGPDFYLGAALRIPGIEPIMVNGGWVWQRTPRLPRGLAVGSMVEDPEILNGLPKHYRPALFFGVGLGR